VILTAVALMYGNKAKQERSSSILIQEGLYRKALELMKAPPLDSKGTYRHLSTLQVIEINNDCPQQLLSAFFRDNKHGKSRSNSFSKSRVCGVTTDSREQKKRRRENEIMGRISVEKQTHFSIRSIDSLRAVR
jgi:hypothetical protein